uniref:Ig-like domain-containing protein n=1 Tax=Clytia hemisphaerica TaxID=252671 RepID=A0A7M5UZA9_9CNID
MGSQQDGDKEFARSFLLGQLGRRNRAPSDKGGSSGFVFSAQKVQKDSVERKNSNNQDSSSGSERRASVVRKNPEPVHYGIEVQTPAPFDHVATRGSHAVLQSPSTESLQDKFHHAVQLVKGDNSKPIFTSNKWQVNLKPSDDVSEDLLNKGYSKVEPPTSPMKSPASPSKSPVWAPPQPQKTYRKVSLDFMNGGQANGPSQLQFPAEQNGYHSQASLNHKLSNGHTQNGISVNVNGGSAHPFNDHDDDYEEEQHVPINKPVSVVIGQNANHRKIIIANDSGSENEEESVSTTRRNIIIANNNDEDNESENEEDRVNIFKQKMEEEQNERRLSAERKAEEDRFDNERKAEELTLENERKAEKERIESERIAEEERVENERKAEEERIESERIAEEERVENERKAEEERIESERIAEEERLENERKAEEEKLENERKAKEESNKTSSLPRRKTVVDNDSRREKLKDDYKSELQRKKEERERRKLEEQEKRKAEQEKRKAELEKKAAERKAVEEKRAEERKRKAEATEDKIAAENDAEVKIVAELDMTTTTDNKVLEARKAEEARKAAVTRKADLARKTDDLKKGKSDSFNDDKESSDFEKKKQERERRKKDEYELKKAEHDKQTELAKSKGELTSLRKLSKGSKKGSKDEVEDAVGDVVEKLSEEKSEQKKPVKIGREKLKDDYKSELQRKKEERERRKLEEQEKRKAEQEKRKAELEKKAAERKAEEERRADERKKKAEARQAEEEKRTAEKELKAAEKQAKDERKAEEKRAEDARTAEEKRIEEEKKIEEEEKRAAAKQAELEKEAVVNEAEEQESLKVEQKVEEQKVAIEKTGSLSRSGRRKIIVADKTDSTESKKKSSPRSTLERGEKPKSEFERKKEERERRKLEEQEKRKAEQEKRKAELEKKAAERKAEEERRAKERKKKAEARQAEEEKRAAEKERKAAEKRAEEERIAEEKRVEAEKKAGEKRVQEEQEAAKKQAELEREAKEEKAEEERLAKEKLAKEQESEVEKSGSLSTSGSLSRSERRKVIVADESDSTESKKKSSPRSTLERGEKPKSEFERKKEERERRKLEEQEKRKAEQEKRKAELEKKAAERKAEEERRADERKKKAEVRQAEEEKRAAEKERKAAEKRAEEERIAEEKRIKAEKKAEEKRVQEEQEAAKKQAELERKAKEEKAEEERLAKEKLAKEQESEVEKSGSLSRSGRRKVIVADETDSTESKKKSSPRSTLERGEKPKSEFERKKEERERRKLEEQEKQKAEQEKRKAELEKKAAERKAVEERRAEERKKKAEAKQAEEEKRTAEKERKAAEKQAEDERIAEEKRVEEERKASEKKTKEENIVQQKLEEDPLNEKRKTEEEEHLKADGKIEEEAKEKSSSLSRAGRRKVIADDEEQPKRISPRSTLEREDNSKSELQRKKEERERRKLEEQEKRKAEQEKRKAEQEKRKAEFEKKAAERKAEDERKAAEQKKKDELKQALEQRKATEKRLEGEQREAERIAEEEKKAAEEKAEQERLEKERIEAEEAERKRIEEEASREPVKPTEPVLSKAFEESVATHEGQPLKLIAKVTPEPDLTISWMKDGEPLKSDAHYKITANKDGTQTLTIRSVKLEDSAEYSIKFTNSVGDTITTSKVLVDKKPKAPVFKKRLPATTSVVEGQNAEFQVNIDGHPKPALQWQFKGADIPEDSNIKIEETEEGKYMVVIQECQLSDKGAFKCTATNKSGSINCQTNITVKVGPPKVVLLSDEKALVEGSENAIFKVQLPSDGAKYKVDWMKGTKPIFRSTKKYDIASEGLVHSFTVVDCQEADQGVFKCNITGPGGKTTKEFNLEIKEPEPQIPTVEEQSSEEVISTPGGSVTLECRSNGYPEPKAIWLRNEVEIKPSDNIVIKSKDGVHSMTIKSIVLDDDAEYFCQVSNKHGAVEAIFSIIVEEEKTKPTFLETLEDLNIKEGEEAEFSVLVESSPDANVEWFIGDELVKDGGRYEIVVEGEVDKIYSLVIGDCTIDDCATIKCVATNDIGDVSCTADLNVEREAVIPKANLLPPKTSIAEASKPFDVSVNIENALSVIWLFNGEEVDKSYKTSQDGDQYTMQIPSMKPALSGKYAVEAISPTGQVLKEEFEIKCKDIVPTIQSASDKTTTIEEGKPMELSITVANVDKTKWLYNGKKVGPAVKLNEKGDTYTLSIASMKKSNAGTYVFEASSVTGHVVKESFDVHFREGRKTEFGVSSRSSDTKKEPKATPPKPAPKTQRKPGQEEPTFVLEPKDKTVVEGNQLKLTASVNGKPTPLVEWYKENSLLKSSSTIDIQATRNLHNMVIRKATTKDAGVYRCTARNEAGQCTVEVNIKIDTKSNKPKLSPNHPAFTRELEDFYEAEEGNDVEMKVEFTGKPKPRIHWEKNGKNIVSIKRVKIHEEDGASQLLIKALRDTDFGDYSCTISNFHGNTKSTSCLRLCSDGTPDIHINTPSPPPPPISSTTNQECSNLDEYDATDDEVAVITDRRNDQNTSNDIGMKLLQIKELHPGLNREVTRHKFPGACGIDVVVMPATPRDSPVSGAQPVIKTKPEDLDLNIGEKALFELQLADDTDLAKVNVSWSKNGQILFGSGRTRIWNKDYSFFLEISKVDVDDESLYEVRVRNDYGEVMCDVQLLVNDEEELSEEEESEVEEEEVKLKITKPKFTKKLQKQYQLIEGEKLLLEVTTQGGPCDIAWYYEGKKLLPSDFMQLVTEVIAINLLSQKQFWMMRESIRVQYLTNSVKMKLKLTSL